MIQIRSQDLRALYASFWSPWAWMLFGLGRDPRPSEREYRTYLSRDLPDLYLSGGGSAGASRGDRSASIQPSGNCYCNGASHHRLEATVAGRSPTLTQSEPNRAQDTTAEGTGECSAHGKRPRTD